MDVMIEVSFENKDALEFYIIPETGWDKIKKTFGHLEEIEVGQSDFDAMFLVKGNDEGKIKSLFSKPHIREFLLNQGSLALELTPTSLNFYTLLSIGSFDHLKVIYDGFSEILNELCLMDSGYENQS